MMVYIEEKDLDRALDLICRAQLLFLEELNASSWDRAEIVNGLEKLGTALEHANYADGEIQICAKCGSVCTDVLGEGDHQCNDCDHVWNTFFKRGRKVKREEKNKPASNIHTALDLLQQALDILENQPESKLKKSAIYLRESISWVERVRSAPRMPA